MRELYVIDTCVLISFFGDVFTHAKGYERSPLLTTRTKGAISEAVYSRHTRVRLSIPSVVFVEIYEKWLRSREFCRRFFYEVFAPLRESPNVEIRAIDREVLGNLLKIGGRLARHDLHDRLVLACAMSLDAPLFTTDEEVTKYVEESGAIPGVLR